MVKEPALSPAFRRQYSACGEENTCACGVGGWVRGRGEGVCGVCGVVLVVCVGGDAFGAKRGDTLLDGCTDRPLDAGN